MTTTAPRPAATRPTRWRSVDIVVASVLAVALGALMWAFNVYLYGPVSGLVGAFPPLGGLYGGIWLLPGVVGMLVIRKPGAAVYTELVAAMVSVALPGGAWGGTVTLAYGFFEGLAPELVFLATRYRSFRLPVAVAAGAAAGLALALLDTTFYFPEWTVAWKLAYAGIAAGAATVTVGLAGWALVRALAATGVLTPFASGREQDEV